MLRISRIVLVLLLAFVAIARAQDVAVPTLTSRVFDETGTLSPEQKESLDRKLTAYEDSTSTQIVVVLMKTIGTNDVSDFAIRIGNENHLGQSKKNNGIVILVSKDDHKAFIATGYGLEPSVTDAVASVIFQDVLRPALRANDFYGGLNATVDSIVSAAKGEFKGTGKPAVRRQSSSDRGTGFIIVLVIFIIIAFIRGAVGTGMRRTVVGSGGVNHGFMSGFLSALFWSSIFRDNDRRGGGFGGFGGGGFGGFGGGGGGFSGGGGSFGGGGAGGSW